MSAGWRMTVVSLLGLGLAACGGSDDPADSSGTAAATPTTATPTTATPTTRPETTVTAPETAPPTPATASAAPPATEAPTTTEAPPVAVTFDLTTLPALISGLEAAVTGGDPLELAMQLGGFPYEVPVPDGSTIARIDTVVRSDADVREHEFSYSVIAPGGAVPDIDITLDDNGPGSIEIIEVWDPIMAALGFERANSTGSDPGDPGGPNSVNHVYVPSESAPTAVNGVPSTPGNVFVWSEEDVAGAASGLDPTDPLGGYQIDADAEIDASRPLGVPLLAAIVEQLPLPEGTELKQATLRLESRSPEAFEIDRGAHYVSISLEWVAPGATVDELAAFYVDPAIFTGGALTAAEASFFEEGTYEPAQVAPYGDADQRLPLLLLRRYEGTLWIEAPTDPADPVTISYDVALNPNDVELAPAS